jgi:hypothetical protein
MKRAFVNTAFLSTIMSASLVHADVYDPASNHLSIDSVWVGDKEYRGVVISVGNVISVTSEKDIATSPSSNNSSSDYYNPTTNQLWISSVRVGNKEYSGVTITVGQVISISDEIASITPTATPSFVTKTEKPDGLAIEIPYDFGGNYVIDNDKIILAGGDRGNTAGATHDGSPAFSKEIYVIDANSGNVDTYKIEVKTASLFSDPNQPRSGIGTRAIIKKLTNGQYYIYGGFQYSTAFFILDVEKKTLKQYDSKISYVLPNGIGTTPFYYNMQASGSTSNNDILFFGFNDGAYPNGSILKFDFASLKFIGINSKLTMTRNMIDATQLKDGRFLLLGGWDGTALPTPNSATRRVEIYDPITDQIQRVADFPEPFSSGQHHGNDYVADDQVCITATSFIAYTYTPSSNTWSKGCNIPKPKKTIFSSMESNVGDRLTSMTSTGYSIEIKPAAWSPSAGYSNDCQCYPFTEPTRIRIYK